MDGVFKYKKPGIFLFLGNDKTGRMHPRHRKYLAILEEASAYIKNDVIVLAGGLTTKHGLYAGQEFGMSNKTTIVELPQVNKPFFS